MAQPCHNSLHDEWVDEAIATLKHFKAAFSEDFLRQHNITPPAGTPPLAAIRAAVLEKRIEFEDLVDYLDQLSFYGKHHVFLFLLRRRPAEYLEKLRDPRFIQEKLQNAGEGSAWENRQVVWVSSFPRLAAVRYREVGGKRQLVCKWVYSRCHQVIQKDVAPGPVLLSEAARAVAYLLIDLQDGSARLNIPILPTFPDRTLREEYDILKQEIARFIDWSDYAPLALEPLLKRFLWRSILPITVWKIYYSKVGMVQGQRNPSYLFKLGLPFKHFFSKEITLYWKVKQIAQVKSTLFFTLNGENDGVTFNAITDPDKIDYILVRLKALSSETIEMKELRLTLLTYPEYSRILAMIDSRFGTMNETRISAKQLAEEVWFAEHTVTEIFTHLAERFPRTFHLEHKGGVTLCLRNRFNLRDGSLEYIRRSLGKSKHRKVWRAVTNSALGLTFIYSIFEKEMVSWIVERFSHAFFRVDFIIVKLIVLLVLAALFFGTRTLFQRIPAAVFSALSLLNLVSDEDLLSMRFGRNYHHRDGA